LTSAKLSESDKSRCLKPAINSALRLVTERFLPRVVHRGGQAVGQPACMSSEREFCATLWVIRSGESHGCSHPNKNGRNRLVL